MRRFHSLKIAAIEPNAEDAVEISLDVPAALQEEFRGLAGQHVVLRAELEGVQIRRTYSLISPPGEWPLRIAARIHEHGCLSRHLAQHVRAGDEIDVLPPNGSMTVRRAAHESSAPTYVAFAAGCGITPVLAVAAETLRSEKRSRFILFYGNTATSRAMCLEEVLSLKDRYLDRLAVHFVMSREPQDVALYNGRLDGERVRELARQQLFQPSAVAGFFLCGPGDLIEQVSAALRALEVPAERIHSEHFRVSETETARPGAVSEASATAPPAGKPASRTEPCAPSAQDAAEVIVLMDGRRRSFTMKMNDETVLDAAEKAGLELPFSCRAGVCSTCRTKVIRGEVQMAQNYALEDWELEQGYVLACQSHVKTAVLELDYDEK